MEELELEQLAEEINVLLEGKNIPKLKQLLTPLNPADIALIFQDIDEETRLPFIFPYSPRSLPQRYSSKWTATCRSC